jgi:hypothetical protein
MRIVPLAKQHGGAEFHSLLTKRKDLCNDSSLVNGKQSFGIPILTPLSDQTQHLKLLRVMAQLTRWPRCWNPEKEN